MEGGEDKTPHPEATTAQAPIPSRLPAAAEGQQTVSSVSGDVLVAVSQSGETKDLIDVVNDVIKSGLCASGMYDLGPVLLSARSSYVMLSAEEIEALSPERHVERVRCPVVVAYGEGESPEFQRQARDFAAALKAAGRPVELLRADGVNHFEMLDLLGTNDGVLARAALDQMGLA